MGALPLSERLAQAMVTSPEAFGSATVSISAELIREVVAALEGPLVVDLGVGRFQIGGTPKEYPPRLHIYRDDHDQPIGSDVPNEKQPAEPVATLVFHNRDALFHFQRAVALTGSWFPIDSRMVT